MGGCAGHCPDLPCGADRRIILWDILLREDSGTGLTMPAVVREINQKYLDKLDAIKAGTAHDRLEMVGSRAVWREVLAVYAVKTTTDPGYTTRSGHDG